MTREDGYKDMVLGSRTEILGVWRSGYFGLTQLAADMYRVLGIEKSYFSLVDRT